MSASGAIYFDSALIAKFYLNEAGRNIVRNLAREAGRVVSSAIARAEVSAAFHRKLREHSVDTGAFKALQGQFAHDLKTGLWTMVPVTDILLDGVQELFSKLNPGVYLRSLDALHLMTARGEKIDRVYTNDRHLLAAWLSVGVEGVNPLA